MTPPILTLPGPYTGVGSRRTPDAVLHVMGQIGACLAVKGFTLRSGGAPGADTFFAIGAAWPGRFAAAPMEIFLPWKGFNGTHTFVTLTEPSPEAFTIAAAHHPRWNRLSAAAQKLHARNAHQIAGRYLNHVSHFVVCWTPDGATTKEETSAATGGTGQAIRIASHYNVPVWNLQRGDHLAQWMNILENRRTP